MSANTREYTLRMWEDRISIQQDNDEVVLSMDQLYLIARGAMSVSDRFKMLLGREIKIVQNQNKKLKSKPKKHRYGEFKHVLLTDQERDRLINEKWGKELFDYMVRQLDNWIEEKGYSSKSHNMTLQRWYRESNQHNPKCPPANPARGSLDFGEQTDSSKARAIELMGGKLIAREICEALGITFDEWRERAKTEGVWDDLVHALEARDA